MKERVGGGGNERVRWGRWGGELGEVVGREYKEGWERGRQKEGGEGEGL